MDSTQLGRQDSIEECLRCYRTCFEMAMTHCLEQGENTWHRRTSGS